MVSSFTLVAGGLSGLLSALPAPALLQERVAAAVARHDYAALSVAADALSQLPGYAVSASAARDFAALAGAGAPAAARCEAGSSDGALYLTELAGLLERSLRFDEAASCLVSAAAVEPTVVRRETAARALLRAGRDAEAAALLASEGDSALGWDAAALASREMVVSSRWSGLRWRASGADAAAFGAEVEAAYGAFAAAAGGPLEGVITVERLEAGLRRRARFGAGEAPAAAGVTLDRLVSMEEGLPAAVAREVVWHELAHAFAAVRLPYGGSPWLSEAVAFAWSRSLMPSAAVAPLAPAAPDGDWLTWLDVSDAAPMSAAERAARDGLAASVGGWFAERFGIEALLVAYAATGRGALPTAALVGASGLEPTQLRSAFETDAGAVSRPTGRTGP